MTTPPILILGARSDIGMAIAHAYAAEGHPVQLAARRADTLEADRADIALRHDVPVTLHEFDALATGTHGSFVAALPELPQVAVCAVGLMGRQEDSERDSDAATLVIRSNFEGPASILAVLANRFEARGSGTIIGISSVAGERGRATNYVYGAAKAGFTAFLSGLRNRLAGSGVHVMTVLPGFVATRMTAGMDLPARLTTDPETLARRVLRAARAGRNVIYVMRIWWLIMLIIRTIPEPVFKRLRL
ncbi:SDR family oxidoreductase [Roseovarius ramblicola]|uniref:SDR family oxidoreductase n=1 Tax=Roseovarius ramblicola TaxID=2022336 RepID=A0ABV5I2C2_9RHOB